jgi:UDP-2,3-diacylglucosamine hydrolase
MKIAAISDVHIKSPGDEAEKLILKFLHHPFVKDSDYILLLGDIFDLMCGPHEEYLKMYPHIFKTLQTYLDLGKKVYFFEGNHDVHLEKLFKDVWGNSKIVITQRPVILELAEKKYYFSHGDEHEVDNKNYHRYMRVIRSKPLKIFAERILPFRLLNYIGTRASRISRKKGSKHFDIEKVRLTFREGVRKMTQGKFDFVLGGHSHVKDSFLIPGTQSLYLNNGYALQSKTFIFINNHHAEFIPLS